MSVINNVLELSQSKADRVINNGEYHVTLASPLTVNPGDQVNFRMASLDSQRVQSNTIVIPQATPISLTYSAYDIDYDVTDKVVFDRSTDWGTGSPKIPTFDYYAAYTDSSEYYTLQSLKVTIKNYVPWFGTGGTNQLNAGSMLFDVRAGGNPYFNGGTPNNIGFLVIATYIDISGKQQTLYLSGGNAQQLLPATNNASPFPGGAISTQGQAVEATENATLFIAQNLGGSGPLIGPRPLTVGLEGTNIICVPLQFDPDFDPGSPLGYPELKNVIFKYGTLKIIGINGYWANQDTNVFGWIPRSGGPTNYGLVPISAGPFFQTGLGSFDPISSCVPTGGAGTLVGDNPVVPVQADQFIIDTRLIEEGGGVEALPYLPGGANQIQLDVRVSSIVLPAGSYDPQGLAITLTQLLNDSNDTQQSGDPSTAFVSPVSGENQQYIPMNTFLQRTDDNRIQGTYFHRIDNSYGDVTFDNTNTYEYYNLSQDAREPYFIGTSQFALEYGSAGQVFSLDYAHMSLFNPDEASGQREMVGIFWTGNPASKTLRYYQVNQASGIVFHDLQPASFWQDQLGIRDKLIVNLQTDTNGVLYYLKNDMLPKITFGYSSLNQFMLTAQTGQGGSQGAHTTGITPRKMTPIPPSVSAGKPDVVYIDVTGNTRAIIGSTITAPVAGGFYKIEIIGLGYRRGSYVDTEQLNPKISAIASAQYTQGNIITAFGDSGIPYVHVGSPYIISEAYVRILDADGKTPPDLGANNTIWVDVLSQDAILLQQQAAEKQKAMQQVLNANKQTQRPDARDS